MPRHSVGYNIDFVRRLFSTVDVGLMVDPDFLCPRLVGERFDSHAIPLELLGDLAVFEAMVIEVAKWRYLQDNPARQRVPRKFTEGITLGLTSVTDGSALTKIALYLAISGVPQGQLEYLVQARDAIINAIAAAETDKSPVVYLPAKSLAYFDRLGRSLLDGETIEFRSGERSPVARLTKETRLRLLRAAQVTERSEEIHLRGGIHAIDQEQLTFEIMLPDGSKIPGPISKPHMDTIVEASYTYRHGAKVLLDGVGQYNRSERLQKIESVEHITLLDPLDFQTQLEELRVLKNGWYDGEGLALPAEGLDWLVSTFNENYPDYLSPPYVYPVAEGGVRLEWSLEPHEISLEIDLHSHIGEWHSLNLQTDAEEARSLKLEHKDAWLWLLGRLKTQLRTEE